MDGGPPPGILGRSAYATFRHRNSGEPTFAAGVAIGATLRCKAPPLGWTAVAAPPGPRVEQKSPAWCRHFCGSAAAIRDPVLCSLAGGVRWTGFGASSPPAQASTLYKPDRCELVAQPVGRDCEPQGSQVVDLHSQLFVPVDQHKSQVGTYPQHNSHKEQRQDAGVP